MSAATTIARPRVLLVDDNLELVDNLRDILGEAGYEVCIAGSCAEAQAVAAQGLDLALVDLRLPDGDGTFLAARLKELRPDCEVILLTGFATVESAAAAVRAGAWAYLIKPVSTPELLRTVEQAMRQVTAQNEKRELAKRAQVAERLAAVGTLTAGLSHEIRNPLNGASLQLAVLERRIQKLPPELVPPLMGPLVLVRDEIRRLDQLLEDFLQFARPAQFEAKPVDLAALLEKVASFLSGDAERRGVRLEWVRPPGLSLVAGDEGRLRQVFMNLALNAMDAAPRGGWVRVECADAGEEVCIVVEDNGSGIPPEMAERIFEPFFTTKAAGSGLGLPIVHAIVSQHAGSITLGRGKAGGARFALYLPKAA
ncbi:MAG: sensor histidine kinase [Myxococcota bacterium]